MTRRPRVLLFDLDGTLADTERVALEVIDRYFRDRNQPVVPLDLEYIVGRAWLVGVTYLLERYPVPGTPATVEREVLAVYRETLVREVPPIAGSAEAVRRLGREFRLGVVSGSRKEEIALVLASLGIGGCFEHVVGFEDYAQSKPSPAPYLEALRRFGVLPSEALVFEDSPTGVEAARAAGLGVVVVGTATIPPPIIARIPDFTAVDAAWVRRKVRPHFVSAALTK